MGDYILEIVLLIIFGISFYKARQMAINPQNSNAIRTGARIAQVIFAILMIIVILLTIMVIAARIFLG